MLNLQTKSIHATLLVVHTLFLIDLEAFSGMKGVLAKLQYAKLLTVNMLVLNLG